MLGEEKLLFWSIPPPLKHLGQGLSIKKKNNQQLYYSNQA